MKKIKIWLLMFATLFLVCCMKDVHNVAINATFDKVSVYVNEVIDLDLFTVHVYNSKGKSTLLTKEEYVVTPRPFNELGKQTLTVSYQGLETKIHVLAQEKPETDEKELRTLDVALIKESFLLNAAFDDQALLVKAICTDYSEEILSASDYGIENFNKYILGFQTITVTYQNIGKNVRIYVYHPFPKNIVENLRATGDTGKITLNWDLPLLTDQVVSYEIKNLKTGQLYEVDGNLSEYTVNDLMNHETYTFSIRAKLSNNLYTAYTYVTEKAEKVYNIYIHFGTLPILYTALEMFNNTNESYYYFSRTGTINTDYLPSHVTYINKTNNREILSKVRELNALNPEAVFNLYVDDLRVALVLDILYAGGVSENRQNIILLPDGTGTYSLPYQITDEFYASAKANWDNYVQDYLTGEEFLWGDSDPDPLNMGRYAYYLSTLSNVEYWVQYKDLIQSNSEIFNANIKYMNLVQKNPYDMYQQLKPEDKILFEKMVLTGSDITNNVEYYNNEFLGTDKRLLLELNEFN